MFYPDGNGAEGSFTESEFWQKSPDLAGCTITRIRQADKVPADPENA